MARRRVAAVLVAVSLAAGFLAAQGQANAGPAERRTARFHHLDPGGQPNLKEKVPVNVVLVGYDRHSVKAGKLLRALPDGYKPIVRSRNAYGEVEKLGIKYRYDYDLTFASRRYENRLFRYLSSIAADAPITAFQDTYNDQAGTLDVTDNDCIDAPSVERWLAYHAPRGRQHPREHRLPDQLVRPARLRVPRLHQDRRARPGHRLRLRRAA